MLKNITSRSLFNYPDLIMSPKDFLGLMYSFYYPGINAASFSQVIWLKSKVMKEQEKKITDGNLVWGYMPILFVKLK